ncbi:unnamed protein product [Ilex paraguariensis]|uniref:Uncharacterized protein n=1 Tax=Ilex paraguariensis TaxID=185542 RepID=A0ABC8SLI8_9AQUA
MKEQCGCVSGKSAFWTVCPHCYCLYEYEKVYEGCCLMCQNDQCWKGFHAMALPSPPPIEVVEMGQYSSFGSILGFEGDEGKGLLPWMPFSPFVAQVEIKEEKKNDVHEDDNVWERDSFIENFDDSDDFYGENGSKNEVTLENFNAKKVKTEEKMKKGSESNNGLERSVESEVPNTGKMAMKSKKSVAERKKLLMGNGTGNKINEGYPHSGEELGLKVEASEDNEHFDSWFGAGVGIGNGGNDFVMGEVEFFEGVDDIYVGLQEISDAS